MGWKGWVSGRARRAGRGQGPPGTLLLSAQATTQTTRLVPSGPQFEQDAIQGLKLAPRPGLRRQGMWGQQCLGAWVVQARRKGVVADL